ncbi:MAG: TetR/AcrR family transcriptional regulator [Nitrincola lacisaponensis]|uniref:Transcriptional regulator RutR of pyrimidine catabolism (TetR family) n=1 Tax=Nitrincola lacisaponensis TaxID=267850 RepID=A0A063Y0Z9_9GAMM|nr:TetR/AcrR family transcriptional regulator [Nitrincola lacisaponensis]KDE38441.1 Transcriptional regulator RutR of pyrimidine catabolism (TetR family) [Nitrincola lacisaponensis]
MSVKKRSVKPVRRSLAKIRKDNSDQILKVAERLFSDKGYSGTTISAIAKEAGLPKANVLYYFHTKDALYKRVLSNILSIWMLSMNDMTEDQHPRDALRSYIVKKIRQSKEHPHASRIFAAEILHGAPYLREQLETDLKEQFQATCQVFRHWISKQWMDPVNPEHLMFMLWSSTQAYADFQVQSSIMLSKTELDDQDFNEGADLLVRLVLKGCGINQV